MKTISLALLGLLVMGALSGCSSRGKEPPTPPTPPPPPSPTEYIQSKRIVSYNDQLVPTSGVILAYNSQGQVIKQQDQYYDRDKKELINSQNNIYTYQGAQLTKVESFYDGGTGSYRRVGATTYSYQGSQLLKKEDFEIDLNGNLDPKGYEEYTWVGGRKSIMKRYQIFQGRTTLSQSKKYLYQDGKEIEEDYAAGAKTPSMRNEYRYDDKRRTIELTHIQYLPEFDNEGKPTDRYNEVSRQVTYTEYNQRGDISRARYTFSAGGVSSGSTDTYAYSELDEKGNPQKLIVTRSTPGSADQILVQQTFAYTYAKL